ncbi:MAG: Na/Pi cotransporter family protein [Lachnospiraceae bacterium]|nr:Na/Pi cotransporter family protein [Lachnospiraceae bacterium]
MGFSVVLTLCGGLGLFLFGMRIMSESIEAFAGAKLRSILEKLTTNRFMGIFVGLFFTAIIQSSSACTVMVVSFVNSGLMNLYQAAGVIFGSNIGTTVTALLVSFKLEKVAPIILLLGVITVMFGKKQKVKKVAEIVVGFGVLFMGLSSMSASMGSMKDSPELLNVFQSLQSPILGVLLGLVLTAIIQSSSVTVSIMVLMANQGLMGLEMCMYITLGCNIGACTSAVLASLIGTKDAKRAAAIHVLFNVIGTIFMYILFAFDVDLFVKIMSGIAGNDAGRVVAFSHLFIKVIQVIIMTPFIGPLVKLTKLIIPGEEAKVGYRENFQLKYIGNKVVFNPATAVVDVINEMERMALLAGENLNRAMNALVTLDEDDIDEVYKVEENINFLNHSITDYLVKINQSTLPIEDLKSIGALFHVVNDIERIGDHAENVADCAVRRKDTGVPISKEAQKELTEMIDKVNLIFRYSVEMFTTGNDEHIKDIVQLEDYIDNLERKLQQNHVDRLTKGECTPQAGMIFSDVVSGLERVSDHLTNIAYSMLPEEELKLIKSMHSNGEMND